MQKLCECRTVPLPKKKNGNTGIPVDRLPPLLQIRQVRVLMSVRMFPYFRSIPSDKCSSRSYPFSFLSCSLVALSSQGSWYGAACCARNKSRISSVVSSWWYLNNGGRLGCGTPCTFSSSAQQSEHWNLDGIRHLQRGYGWVDGGLKWLVIFLTKGINCLKKIVWDCFMGLHNC